MWLKAIRNQYKIKDWWKVLRSKLRGHFQYYGVSGNYKNIYNFYKETIKLVHKWMNRRSQKKKYNWQRYIEYLKIYELPKPLIYHNLYMSFGC